ncbi:amino acid/amide ABC transporter membrane protein 1, HAAT family [Desulfacinum hydrothermale DSM 13146]|uniref:Amino acid/amide ABC transporter membrane protein 1, HAAT family n=1 Tax=Desulfacinum hydrothermale DSM 13146 TaxID=1121390 RepID=A0A1W1X154_9BACT|nr:branched-chain amino acid ABC transporter permease [Desulfacinum hydrothermale]SMC17696.1 amino acid/amide ABC transporter membrane protein 1, HAAT family [Desulfacinum hydrothermale DSM 13146]
MDSVLIQQLAQFVVSGITSGSVYALIALGFCLVQNATGIVNFAQGDFVMLGGLTAVSLFQDWGLPLPFAFVLAMAFTALVGLALEGGPLRHARNREVLVLVMITVGASISLRGAGMLAWGKNVHTLPAMGGDAPFIVLSAAVLPQTLWVIGISLAVLCLLFLFYRHTLVGKAMRAVADNPYGAALVGISVRRLVALAFALAGAVGALAGVLITPLTTMSYSTGLMLGLKGFAGAILGGYGSTLGAVVGGYLLGLLESLGAGFVSSAYKDAFAFLILLGILFVRPAGLFGSERVRRL